MPLDEIEIWSRVKGLTDRTLMTYVEGKENTIIKVEDTGSPKDKVIIKDRDTSPIREDILAAYQLFQNVGKLCRYTDLNWLSIPEKKTSSIVFRIVGEIAGDKAILKIERPETLILKK